eukprot:CAMPEP_0198123548 /NCGR_PEP_ID=MMETSP1442-20131203/37784_1 /TAXON_ID= /ORGANISM="Craspedostauros australis, Strain CCMP3328" /LENGTH=136 /DNA_ID=CAMNT_0043782767 /DNA_START=57 /DNA_END=464 /DNA_ORIENTATION=+
METAPDLPPSLQAGHHQTGPREHSSAVKDNHPDSMPTEPSRIPPLARPRTPAESVSTHLAVCSAALRVPRIRDHDSPAAGPRLEIDRPVDVVAPVLAAHHLAVSIAADLVHDTNRLLAVVVIFLQRPRTDGSSRAA